MVVSEAEARAVRELADDEIDLSDIPELTEADFHKAVRRAPAGAEAGEDRLETDRPARGEWRWRIIGVNGRIIGASTQGFSTRRACIGNLVVLSRRLSDRSRLLAE